MQVNNPFVKMDVKQGKFCNSLTPKTGFACNPEPGGSTNSTYNQSYPKCFELILNFKKLFTGSIQWSQFCFMPRDMVIILKKFYLPVS
jgi:hypothetical protein